MRHGEPLNVNNNDIHNPFYYRTKKSGIDGS